MLIYFCCAEIYGEFIATHQHKKEQTPKGCLFFFGAADEARTRYLHLGKVALYQMSYSRISLRQMVLYQKRKDLSIEKSKKRKVFLQFKILGRKPL